MVWGFVWYGFVGRGSCIFLGSSKVRARRTLSAVTQQKASLLHFTYYNIYSKKTRNNIWQL